MQPRIRSKSPFDGASFTWPTFVWAKLWYHKADEGLSGFAAVCGSVWPDCMMIWQGKEWQTERDWEKKNLPASEKKKEKRNSLRFYGWRTVNRRYAVWIMNNTRSPSAWNLTEGGYLMNYSTNDKYTTLWFKRKLRTPLFFFLPLLSSV